MASRPGHLAQPHQGDPAQTTGFDHLGAAGTHRITVNAQSADATAPTPLQGFVDAEDQGAIAAIQVLEQQYQQNTRGRTGRPHRPVEHLMVAGEVAVIAATHDPQRRGHRALAWRQYRAHQQHLRFAPGWVAEQRCEGNENGYNGIGQGEHGWTFRRKWGQAILPCPYSFPKKCAKSREGNSNSTTSVAFLSVAFLRQLRAQHTEPLTVIWDNSPAHRGDALRAYLANPNLNLRLVNLPTYSPDFNADEAIWGWVRQEVTANLCLGTRAAVQEKVGDFFASLSSRCDEVKRRCQTVLQARAAELTASTQADPSHPANVDFTLASV